MFPVRVSVETVRAQHCLSCAHDGHLLIDTYAIVSGSTLLSQLVDTVLSALGHPHLAVNSRGLVQINNWKALPFEQITDNLDDTVDTLFKDIAGHLTLRILTKPSTSDSSSTQCIIDLKQRLLKLAMSKQPQLLSTLDNTQMKELVNQVIAGDDPPVLSADMISALNEWLDSMDGKDERRSPVGNVRFNPLMEIPKLERWFKQDPSPNRQKLLHFMNILNSSSYRHNNQKVTYQQLCNWFSNQRAAKRPSPLSSVNGASTPVHVSQSLSTTSSRVDVPISMIAENYKTKFDLNALIESCNKKAAENELSRIDGCESPSPDQSVQSPSDIADSTFSYLKQESTASSPDLSHNVASSVASSSPKPVSMDMGGNNSNVAARSRLMFDPLTELPVLEKWFEENPHPTWMQIDNYTQTLNSCPYRENYPHISQHNVKIWFKNRRAKCKRLQSGMADNRALLGALSPGQNRGQGVEIPSFLTA